MVVRSKNRIESQKTNKQTNAREMSFRILLFVVFNSQTKYVKLPDEDCSRCLDETFLVKCGHLVKKKSLWWMNMKEFCPVQGLPKTFSVHPGIGFGSLEILFIEHFLGPDRIAASLTHLDHGFSAGRWPLIKFKMTTK